MKRKALISILAIMLMVVYIQMPSYAESAGETGEPVYSDEIENSQNLEPISCEADIDPSLRETVIKRDNSNIVELRTAAHRKVREFLNYYADIDHYRTNDFTLTSAQSAEAIAVAEEATSGCSTDYEKIQAIYELVAENIYYDYDYYYRVTSSTNQGYDVWTNKISVCSGYAQICQIFLNCLGIPCEYVTGDNHAYNAAYDRQSEQWIFFDATWGSKNTYRDGVKTYNGHNNNYYDMSVEYIAKLNHHEYYPDIYFRSIENSGNVNYALSTPRPADVWPDMSLWRMIVSSPQNQNSESITIGLTEIAGFPVAIGSRAFHGCSNLTSITIPEGVTGIGSYAFYDCSNLSSINIPGSVTSIGEASFHGCSRLTGITIPEGVTVIGNKVFEDCSNLLSVSMSGSVTSIGSYTFKGCTSLRSFTVPKNVTSIGNYAFSGCRNMSSITIPNGVTKIGDYAFTGCTSLKNIALPESMPIVESGVFYGCTGLTSVTIPEGITSIRSSAFRGCTGLTSISIPESVTGIGDYTFAECGNLTNIPIPEGVTDIGEYAFYRCRSLAVVTVPETVTAIGGSAFRECSSMTSVSLPKTVTSFGKFVFYGCSNLTAVILPEGISSIEKYTFYDCKNLTSVTIPEGITSIGEYAFWYCRGLTDVTIPKGVKTIGDYAFNGCSALKTITLPESTTRIGQYAFSGCSQLIKAVIPSGVTNIGNNAFNHCNESLCIYCVENSTAHTYAIENSISYKLVISLSDCEIILNQDDYTSTGEPVKPNVTIQYGGSVLTEGSQYFVSESDAVYGDTFATITGLDNYIGEVLIYFTISDHRWSNTYTIDKEPTCTEDGVESIHCIDCGEVKEGSERVIEKKGHKCADWHITADPTCTEDGAREAVCSVCNEAVTESIPAAGHIWSDDYIIDREATCTSDGEESIHCSVCNGKKDSRVIPATGHSFGEWVTVELASCENAGLQQRTCDICGFTEANELNLLGHDWEEDYTTDVPAACTTDGTESIHCKNCDAKKDCRTIPATGHHELVTHDGKDATCTEAGYSAYETCSNCSYTTYQEIPALGHSWVSAEKPAGLLKNGCKYQQCIVCGAQKDKVVIAGYANSYVKSFKVSKGKRSFTAKWKKQSKANQSKFNGYQIRYSTASNMSGAKYVTASKSSASKKIKGLRKKTKYYVQVRTYTKTGSGTFYSSWSAKKSVKTK